MNIVSVSGVTKHYLGPPAVHALSAVTLEIQSGQHTGLMGPSGSGKSTLLNLIGALDTPTEGSVLVSETELSQASERERAAFRRNELGFVFQASHLLPDRSVVENVELALICRDGRRRVGHRSLARDTLRQVGLDHRWDAMPRHLSGGEQQRTAIARALVAGPSLLLMDEPTGSLDSESAAKVLDLVTKAVRDGLTAITATHDPEVAARCDALFQLRDGMVVA